ncbi:MAG: TonB-dependent receptor plug domain-containing protein, partial [Neisseriaceae bacterium]|nr:TonB-dependent receptor plug domain-containing protein [Neisseriaceae bacterium]
MGMFRKQAVWWLLVPMALSQTAKGETTEAAEAAAEQEAYLDDVVVIGGLNRDRQGYNDVYDQDISTVYAGKAAIERYKGTTPSDVFKGMLGVYSGDARNSGALDPNIRGIQGQGRVPLTVDGTEQSITTWRGYNGANNRNYIDPNLIGSIQVEKGPSMTRGVNSSVGGAVVIKTLGVDDIVPAGETFGGEIKTEFSNNTVRQRLPQSLAGQDYRDVPGWNSIYNDPSLMMIPKRSGDNKLLSGQDQAYRVALGLRQDNFDLLAAYSYRNRGNYFSGKNGAHNYAGIEATNDTQNTLPKIAEAYKPGDEVPNTSSRLESYLLKGTLRLPQEQTMEFGFRRTEALYGEIMPSRVKWGLGSVVVGSDNWTLDMPQWPLSQVQQNAYHINYKWQPSDQPWFDVDATLWATRYNGNLQNGGGYPNEPYDTDYDWEPGDKPETWNPNVDGRLRNTSAANVRNNRWGLTLSNRLQLHDRLNLTVGGSLQHERIYSSDRYDKRENGIFQAQPREGRRSDNEFNFNFDWQPTDWLALSAGLRRVA